jgi:hypothetical protein
MKSTGLTILFLVVLTTTVLRAIPPSTSSSGCPPQGSFGARVEQTCSGPDRHKTVGVALPTKL